MTFKVIVLKSDDLLQTAITLTLPLFRWSFVQCSCKFSPQNIWTVSSP